MRGRSAGVAQPVEQLICNQQVGGSNPSTSSTTAAQKPNTEEFPSGQRGQTVNLLSVTSMVRIHPPPPQKRRQSASFLHGGGGCWERTPFYKAIAHALILREGGTRKGSAFANNPVGIICKSGGTHTFAQSESPSPDFTRKGHPDGSPCTHSPPSGGAGLRVAFLLFRGQS